MDSLKEIFCTHQSEKIYKGGVSRRKFVSSLAATVMLTPYAFSIVDSALAITPRKKGKFRLGMGHGSTTDSLDPATYENDMMAHIACSWGNQLTEINNKGQLIPELAENFESNDGKKWFFKLRKGVEFHNGKTLDSNDIIATINYHRDESSKSAAKGHLESIKSIIKDSKYTVLFELKSANADFPYILSDYHFGIMPAKDGIINPTSGIGTGGYVLQTWEPGIRFEAKRNLNYFKDDKAHFDEIEILSIIDLGARQSALMNGDVDVVDRLSTQTVGLITLNPNISILEKTGTLHYAFPMRLDSAPFNNFDLRMAIKLSVKRQELIDKILFGHGTLGNDIPLSKANRFLAASLSQREFDLEKAAMHYKKSGHSGKIQLSCSEAAFDGAVDAAQLIAASAKEVGMKIEVVREPQDAYWSNVWNKKGWTACFWSGRPTADWMFTTAYVDSTEWNDTAWKNTNDAKKFNRLVKEARSELDIERRAILYHEAQVLLHNDGGALIPMFANHIMGLSKKIGHSKDVAANSNLDGHKACERWWFV